MDGSSCVDGQIQYMCPSLTFWVQMTILAILRIWYRLKKKCLEIPVIVIE